ncbi:MAG: glycoside hydrolase family 16 protein [Verrucomicrobia bacterium]|nr:glycoside hydrolase family 16 protein [Verrucomicrobiota bacterium]
MSGLLEASPLRLGFWWAMLVSSAVWGAPSVELTYVPPIGSYELLEGVVRGVDPDQYGAAAVIEVFGTWWTKPSWAAPVTKLDAHGAFKIDITTGGQDPAAARIGVFAVPLDAETPLLAGASQIPQALYDLAVAYTIVDRASGTQSIECAGRKWKVKETGDYVWGPGPNRFSAKNVFVDDAGRLHLRITGENGVWRCAEATLEESLGYGSYRFYLESDVSGLPDPIVLGMFVYSEDPEYAHREIDIEFSNGPVVGAPRNWQYVIQPYDLPGHRHRFAVPVPLPRSTHVFTWTPDSVFFESFEGAVSDRRSFAVESSPRVFPAAWESWGAVTAIGEDPGVAVVDPEEKPAQFFRARLSSFAGEPEPLQRREIVEGTPPPGNETVRINLWLWDGTPPSEEDAVYEAVVSGFEFIPLSRPRLEIQKASPGRLELRVGRGSILPRLGR